ncbi:hypothetical protein Huta_0984 [Halorhabdus utahensis DSM 12940]|uniref:Uncharacterized protein n=1 Tax=Halorhabdus utahensis (strain DSM 12940 / JCM 11049 / AX-2) TaxID=519442 RepID=C7NV83_HALUD|nr:hypothetical protein Huta_0984 [Halorhabdus utahensis DSM 12940]
MACENRRFSGDQKTASSGKMKGRGTRGGCEAVAPPRMETATPSPCRHGLRRSATPTSLSGNPGDASREAAEPPCEAVSPPRTRGAQRRAWPVRIAWERSSHEQCERAISPRAYGRFAPVSRHCRPQRGRSRSKDLRSFVMTRERSSLEPRTASRGTGTDEGFLAGFNHLESLSEHYHSGCEHPAAFSHDDIPAPSRCDRCLFLNRFDLAGSQ